jgi:hypothetical protein
MIISSSLDEIVEYVEESREGLSPEGKEELIEMLEETKSRVDEVIDEMGVLAND